MEHHEDNMSDPHKTLTQVVREGVERACSEFTARVTPLGFQRAKRMFWIRRHPLAVELIHFHRHGSTYGAPRTASVDLRVHFGVRILNDGFPILALNGPFSDPGRLRSGRYHLRFNAQTDSTFERCVDDLVRFVAEQGEPWFQRFSGVEGLLELPDSPLNAEQKALLQAAQAGHSNPNNVAKSLKILGIKSE